MTLRRFAKVVARALLEVSAVLLAPTIRLLAKYGFGSSYLMRHGALPLPIHYYSPVPDVPDLLNRDVWSHPSELPGIEFRVKEQVSLLNELAQRFGSECTWPLHAQPDSSIFHLDNSNFSYGCAASLHCMLRYWQPRRVIEVGSGNSSKVIARALAHNAANGGPSAHYEVIDPYPNVEALASLPWDCRVRIQRVELAGLEPYATLGNGDVLFIDSGHTVRIGGDVNFLFLEVIPRLAPGVVVHVHDVNLPYEYDRAYSVGQLGTFRKWWTEAYLLQAFLAFNDQWDVLLALRYLMLEHSPEFRRAFPQFDPSIHRALSSSFWMRRRDHANAAVR